MSANVARAGTKRRSRRPFRLPLGRRFRPASRGQVLLVAVMVLFGVAALAALFVGILGAQLVQVTRYTDIAALRAVAEAGLRLANHDLVYGVRGADWRPRTTPIQVDNRGQVLVRVTYGPTPNDLQSRYLIVSATATFRDNPFASYTILGVKPLLLTDYARCITDRYELRQPASLGVTGVENPVGGPRSDYVFSITGPVFSNTDLVWYGESRVNLATPDQTIDRPHQGSPLGTTWREMGILRDDRIEVAGQMRSPAWDDGSFPADAPRQANPLRLFVNSLPYAGNVFLPQTAEEQYRYRNGFVDLVNGAPVANAWRVLADLPTYRPSLLDPVVSGPVPGGAFSVPRIQPPRMDALEPDLHTNRYLTLTRDSGVWQQVGVGATAAYLNTGAWGWGWAYGGGIYLDNDRDLQYVDEMTGNHDLQALRRNWIAGAPGSGKDGRPADPSVSDWWDKSGRYYAPPGAEIVLHGEAPCPYLEIIRRDIRATKDADGNDVFYVWQDPTGAVIPAEQGSQYRYASANRMWCRPAGSPDAPPFGVDTDGVRAVFPFPPNGVIYAEGNVRLRGIMPPNRNATATMRYFSDPSPRNANVGTPGWSRRYDLQVVSGGTIYIEGDLLSPLGAKLYTSELGTSPATVDVITWDALKGSRVALIARDSVCVNTTAFHPRPANLYTRTASGAVMADSFNDSQRLYPNPSDGFPSYMHFTVEEDGDPRDGPVSTEPAFIDFRYTNVRFSAGALAADLIPDYLKLTLGHSAWYSATPGTDPATLPPPEGKDARLRLQVDINGETMPWSPDGSLSYYEFRVSDQSPPPAPPIGVSYHWYQENLWYTDPANRSPFLPFGTLTNDYLETISRFGDFEGVANWTYFVTGSDGFRFTPTLYPVTTHPTDGSPPQWIVRPTQLAYLLGPVAVAPERLDSQGHVREPLPVRIEALVYAQNGSWFVLPGPWFNENPKDRPQDPADILNEPGSYPFPVYHEPLNIQIQFYGAITENMPASPGDVADWTSKWAGMLTSKQAPHAAGRSLGITYEYDPLLRQARLEDLGACPRFPNLPLSPDLLIWGERVAGFSNAGT